MKFIKKENYYLLVSVLFVLAAIAMWQVVSYFPEPDGLITSIVYGLGCVTITINVAAGSAVCVAKMIFKVLERLGFKVRVY